MDLVNLRDHCRQIEALIRDNEPNSAIRLAIHTLHHFPRCIQAYRLLGDALLESGNYQEAARQFRRALSADPENPAVRASLSRAYEALENWDDAIVQMRRACDLSPGSSQIRHQLDQLLHSRQPGGPAKRSEITQAGLGRIYAQNGLFSKSIQEYESVLSQEPERLDVQVALAEILWRDGHYQEAIEQCYQILDRYPDVLKANLIVAGMWHESPQPREALPYWEIAESLDPDNTVARDLLGARSSLDPSPAKIERLTESEVKQYSPPISSALAGLTLLQELDPVEEPAVEIEEERAAMSDDDKLRPDEGNDIPDWLKGVGDDLLEGESETDQESPSATLTPPAEDAPEENTPRWLRDLVSHAETTQPDTPAADAAGDAPQESAAASLTMDSSPPSDESDMPVWLTDILAGNPEEGSAEQPAEGEVELTPAETESSSDLTDWLNQVEATEVKAEAGPEQDLSPVAEETVAPAAGTATSGEPEAALPDSIEEVEVVEANLPEWLQEYQGEESVPDLSQKEETLPDTEIEVGQLPEWLQGFQAEETVDSTGEAVEVGELPEWLQDFSGAEAVPDLSQEEALPANAIPESGELPEWLRDAEPEEGAADFLGEESAAVSEIVEGEDLPGWLRDFQGEESIPDLSQQEASVLAEPAAPEEADLAEWLEDFQGEEPAVSGNAAVEVEEVPDWLRDFQGEESVPDLEQKEPPVPVAEVAPQEIPEWLPEEDLSEAVDESVLPEPTSAVNAPGSPEEEAAPPDVSVPAVVLPIAEDEPEVQEISADESEVPDWLRELQTGNLVEEADIATVESVGAAVPVIGEVAGEVDEIEAEIEPEEETSDWLRRLRNGSSVEVTGDVDVAEVEITADETTLASVAPELDSLPTAAEEVDTEPISPSSEEETSPQPPAEPKPEPIEAPPAKEHLAQILETEMPEDPSERLAIARAALKEDKWKQALNVYGALVNSSEQLDTVIEDLEAGVEQHPDDPEGHQLLGDAYMKDGRLPSALRAYRAALSNLNK